MVRVTVRVSFHSRFSSPDAPPDVSDLCQTIIWFFAGYVKQIMPIIGIIGRIGGKWYTVQNEAAWGDKRMDEQAIRKLLEEKGALRIGHFLRASGRHSDHYVQCARLFEQADTGAQIGQLLAQRFENSGAQLVLSAALGGLLPGYEVSRTLLLPFIYCERRDGALTLGRGFDIAPGSRVLIIEDEVQTGTSVREMMEIVKALQGHVAGVGCIVDKSGGSLDFAVPFVALVTSKVASYPAKQCPLCRQGLTLGTAGTT